MLRGRAMRWNIADVLTLFRRLALRPRCPGGSLGERNRWPNCSALRTNRSPTEGRCKTSGPYGSSVFPAWDGKGMSAWMTRTESLGSSTVIGVVETRAGANDHSPPRVASRNSAYGDRFGWRRKSFGEDAVAVQTC